MLFRHQDWAVAITHAGAAGQERVFVAHIGISVNADCGNIEFATKGAFVKCLDVLEYVLEFETIRRNQTFRQAVKHERIVRVRRVAERKRGAIKSIGHIHMECGGKRSATPLWLERLVLRWIRHKHKPKRRRASLAAALDKVPERDRQF